MPLRDTKGLDELMAMAVERGIDARPIILRVQTDLLVMSHMRTPEMVRDYETLARELMMHIDDDTKRIIATKLIAVPEISADLRAALQYNEAPVSTKMSDHINDMDVNAAESIAQHVDETVASIIASRNDLSDDGKNTLLERGETHVDRSLAANTKIILNRSDADRLIARGKHDEKTAQALLSRSDLTGADKAPLYTYANSEQRLAIRTHIEQVDRLASRRLALPVIDDALCEQLVEHARKRNENAFYALLERMIRFSPAEMNTIRADQSCELLILALNLAGLKRDDAIAILLAQHPSVSHSYQALIALLPTLEMTSRACSLRVLSAVLDKAFSYIATTNAQHTPFVHNSLEKELPIARLAQEPAAKNIIKKA